MTRNFLGTTTTNRFLLGLSDGSFDGVISVVATSNHYDAVSARELVASRGMENTVLIVEFVDEADPNYPGVLDEEGAARIYDFLVSHDEGDVSYLFVCDGSISRSSGLMCAWMRLCGEDDLPVWTNAADYSPNVLVYARLLAAGGVRMSQRQFNERDLLKWIVFSRMVQGHDTHAMHLRERQWRQIAAGDKSCELRCLDYKRSRVVPGDLIVFATRERPDDFVLADVLERRTASSFEDLLCDEDVVAESGFASDKDALLCLEEIYGKSEYPAVAFFLDTSEWERRIRESA